MSEISNPFSTGGGGTNFEIKVQSSFVVALLTNVYLPTLSNAKIKKIKLQGKADGFDTDDVIVFAEDHQGETKKLLGQIKHAIGFTESDKVLSEVIGCAWKDFTNISLFDPKKDGLVLITGPLTKADANSVRILLDWSKHSESATDFLNRVQLKKYSSDPKRAKLASIRFHLDQAKGSAITDDELWRFCRTWNVIGYDLDSETSATRSGLISLIQLAKGTNQESADSIWNKIVAFVMDANQNASIITLESIPIEITNIFSSQAILNDDIARLREHADVILKRIDNHIGSYRLERDDLKSEITAKINENPFVLVSGVAGSGKSAIVADVIKDLTDGVVFYFRTEDFNFPHIDSALTTIGLQGRLSSLLHQFSLIPRKFLVIESIEKLLELDHTEALPDLMKLLQQDPSWKVIATCRSYSVSQLTLFCLRPVNIFASHVEVESLTNEELSKVKENVSELTALIEKQNLADFLRNPFYLSMLQRIAGDVSGNISIEAVKETIWANIVGKSIERKNGLHLRRMEAFTEVSIRRARQMRLAVNVDGIDSEAISKLEHDELITKFQGETYAPSHDLFEDMAIERFLSKTFESHEVNPENFFEHIGSSLAIRRTFRDWFLNQMREKQNETNIRAFILKVLTSEISSHWKDEIITCVLNSDGVSTILNDLSSSLLQNDAGLLKRFAFILRTACKGPDHGTMKLLGLKTDASSLIAASFLKPTGPGWTALIKFIRENMPSLDHKFISHVTPLLKDWSYQININNLDVPELREGGLVAIYFLNLIKDTYRNEYMDDLIEVLIKTYPGIQPEIDSMLEEDLFKNSQRRKPRYIETFCEQLLTTFTGAFLCQFNPKLVIAVAWATWKKEEEEEEHYRALHDIEAHFGLEDHNTKTSFTFGSAIKGPFWSLLLHHPKIGIDFILDLTNYAAENYESSYLAQEESTRIELDFGDTKISQICSSRLWGAYTGTQVVPGTVMCALMALEKWLVNKVEQGESIETDIDFILRKSKSVLTTSVIAGVTAGYWRQTGKSILSVLRCRNLFSLDMARTIMHQSAGSFDWFQFQFHDPMASLHSDDRKKALSYEWRKSHLEDVVRNMLFGPHQEEIGKILDEYYAALPAEKDQSERDKIWRIALGRMDLRKYSTSEDKENKMIVLTAPPSPADIQQIQDESAKKHQYESRFIKLNVWGNQKYRHELIEEKYYPNWKEALKEAQWAVSEINKNPEGEMSRIFLGGIFYTVAFCVREHLSEIDRDDLVWIVKLLVDLIDKTSELWLTHDFDESGIDGYHAATNCLPRLFSATNIPEKEALRKSIAHAVIHPSSAIQLGVAQGIKQYLWESDPAFASSCLSGNIAFSQAHHDLTLVHAGRTEKERKEKFLKVQAKFQSIRDDILSGSIAFSLTDFSFQKYSSWDLKAGINMISDINPNENSITLLKTLAVALQQAEEDDDHHNRVDYKLEYAFETKLASIILAKGVEFCRTTFGEIFKKIEDTPEFVASVVEKIVHWDVSYFLEGKAWAIWRYFSELAFQPLVMEAKKPWDSIRFSKLSKVAKALLFGGAEWKGRAFEIQIIESGKDDILNFFKKSGSHPEVFEGFVKLCYHFPNHFLLESLPIIQNFINNDAERKLLKPVNSKYYLEQAILRFVIANLRDLRGKISLNNALIAVLDTLIDEGSSTAYFVRERVVTAFTDR